MLEVGTTLAASACRTCARVGRGVSGRLGIKGGWRAPTIAGSQDIRLWVGRDRRLYLALQAATCEKFSDARQNSQRFSRLSGVRRPGHVSKPSAPRTRPCDDCRGRGIVPPLRREQLLVKLKAKGRERV